MHVRECYYGEIVEVLMMQPIFLAKAMYVFLSTAKF